MVVGRGSVEAVVVVVAARSRPAAIVQRIETEVVVILEEVVRSR